MADEMSEHVRAALKAATAPRMAVPGRPEEGPYPATVGEVADEIVSWINDLEAAGLAHGLARDVRDRLERALAADEGRPGRVGRDSAGRDRSAGDVLMVSDSPTCDGLCVTGADIGIPGHGVAYPHPGCPLHSPGSVCDCGQPDRCLSPTHGQVTMAEALQIRHAQDRKTHRG